LETVVGDRYSDGGMNRGATEGPERKMKSIVLVEDNENVAQLVEYKLKKEPFDVVRASDGIQGLEVIRRIRPDLVILDIMLPKLDGFAVLRELRADVNTRATPVLMLTALAQEQDVAKGFQLGADDYMVKPFRPSELMVRIGKLLTPRENA
jgi:DNA-binding response OmpR family regulator